MAKEMIFNSVDRMIAHCVNLSLPGLSKMLDLTIADIQHPRTSHQKRARAGIILLLSRQFASEGLPVTQTDIANAIDSIDPKMSAQIV